MPRLKRNRREMRNKLAKKINRATHLVTQHKPLVDYAEKVFACGKQFDDAVKSISTFECANCKRAFPDLKLNQQSLCKPCEKNNIKFTALNNMDPGEIPPELDCLNYIEQMFIARVHAVVSLYRIKGAQVGYRGNVVNFVQDISQYTSKLPHKPSDLPSTILFTHNTQAGIAVFRANPHKLTNALEWLKVNNKYYSDIEISEHNLALIPPDGDITSQITSCVVPDQQEDEEVELQNTDTPNADSFFRTADEYHVPIIRTENQQQILDTFVTLPYPEASSVPINEFLDVGYIARAFPRLFPRGIGHLNESRIDKLQAEQYFTFLLRYPDRRFVKDPRFRFFAFNSLLRWRALSAVSVFAKKSQLDKMNLKRLKELIATDRNYLYKIMVCSSKLPSTSAYWRVRRGQLMDMVSQLGSGQIFWTLSAADYHWLDLYRLLAPDTEISTLDEETRRELMHDNADLVSYFFVKRSELFMKHVLKAIFNVSDYWYRYEWQHRGSCHLHGILWLSDAPNVENVQIFKDNQMIDNSDLEDQSNPNQREYTDEAFEIMRYFDVHCSAINPNAPIDKLVREVDSSQHPSRRRFSDVDKGNLLYDLSDLLNNFQRHTKCGDYCYRYKGTDPIPKCRFKFPRECQDSCSIDDSEGYNRFVPRRNDPFLQRYNPIVTQTWRANTDFSPILSKTAVLRYIAKYASKQEPSSKTYTQLLKDIIEKENDNTSAKRILQKLVMSTIGERDYGSQEMSQLLNNQPLARCSRQFVFVRPLSEEWLAITTEQNTVIQQKSLIDKYRVHFSHLLVYIAYSVFCFQRALNC